MCDSIVTPCIECVKCVGPPLKKHLFDFYENVDDFLMVKSELKAKKYSYDQRLAIATRKKELPTEDVKLWIQQYEAIITKCELPEYDENELKRKRRRYTIKRYKFSRKLVKMTIEMMELISQYNKFGSLFVEDLLRKNADILMNFENTKCKLEALKETYEVERKTARRSLKKPSPEVKLWIQNYEANKIKCDVLENNLKHYNTTGGVFTNFGELEHKETEMKELNRRYNEFGSLFVEDLDALFEKYAKTKQEFHAIISTYKERRLSAEKTQKIPTESVRLWSNYCAKLQTKFGGENTKIQVEGESSHRQEEQIGKMEEMENLINRYKQFGGFSEMFVDQPLQIVEKRSTDFMSLSSMKSNKNRVYKALSEGERVIKLFGMGGVGKTTLMKQINNEMSGGTNFELVIWVTVSTTYADIKDIQSQICHRLKLQWSDREEDTVRAEKISEYLKECVDGNCLFIFDDVWRELNLKDIGIPDGNYGNEEMKCCKIVLTTRDKKIKVRNGLYLMLTKDIKMTELDETESWSLFKRYASIDDNVDDEIRKEAEKVCKKCAGLPLVNSVIAKMLSGEEEKDIWSEALTILNKTDSSLDIPHHYFQNVYVPLKLSYKRLGRKDLKIGFLLCSLFPEDYEIAVSDLFCYGMGAGQIAESCQSFDACRNIFIHLKNKGLLQDVEDDDSSARMHDVIRDVAHFIAKEEFGGFFCNAELTMWISSMQNPIDRPGNVKAMKFQPLFGKKIKSEHLDKFVETENVLLLDLRGTLISLQEDSAKLYIKKLKKLRVLISNNLYDTISVNIKEYFILQKLSVLCLRGAHIKELDKEFSIELCNLRVIDFTATKIKVIRPKVFLNLHNKLEVLCMSRSFSKWRASDEEDGEYASFAELLELKKLYLLQVDIEDCDIFSHEYRPDLVFSSVECFLINSFRLYMKWNSKELKQSNIQVMRNGANWIKVLLKKTEILHICLMREYIQNDNGGTEVDVVLTHDILNIMCNLRILYFSFIPKCKNAIQYSSNTEGNHTTSKPILPKAKQFVIRFCKEMENIFVSTLTPPVIPKGSFQKLQSIEITGCPKLNFIFPWNVATCLVQLHSLEIHGCDQLEVIVEKDGRDYDQGVQVLYPELTKMMTIKLPNLEYVSTLTPTVTPEGAFQKLQSIGILHCPRLKFIFPWNVATCLVQLQTLTIKSCDQLEVIVEKENNRGYSKGEQVCFPELTEMMLIKLPKLEYVPSGSDEKLENLKQHWLLGENSAPNLKLIHWDERIFKE